VIPFHGIPWPCQVLLTIAFVVILGMTAWTLALLARGVRAAARAPESRPGGPDDLTWAFLVPALNEEITIGDSVTRLLALPLARRKIIVIDDGSDDATPEVLAACSHPDLHVLRRELPNAREGKAEALNAAYRMLGELLGDTDRERVVVAVVDADGRIAPLAPTHVAGHFADPGIGGVQALVRIYNRGSLLTRMQDIEFGVYGRVYQAGKNPSGTAGMGGNGQFNRLSALDAIVTGGGPWRRRLTEDQDLGLRLLAAGWKCHQELQAVVEQQGVPRLRPLLRQRTRWSQGNLQALGLLGPIWRAPLPRPARLEEAAYLLMPLWQTIIGCAVICAGALVALGDAPVLASPEQIPYLYAIGFGNTVLGCLVARSRDSFRSPVKTVGIAHVYALYTWLLFPTLARAVARQATSRREWNRTDREPLQLTPGEGSLEPPAAGVRSDDMHEAA
jgi:1,2-diacylglycerol 3-beta-glucosyltransferase